jgi:hypothetical protein
MAAFRSALLDDLTEDQLKALGKKLYAAAMGSDWTAAKLLLAYAIGRPREAVDADRLDLDEWRLLDAAPSLAQVIRALLDSCDPAQGAELVSDRRAQKSLDEKLDAALSSDDEDDNDGRVGAIIQRVAQEQQARVGK